ncbi:hypothetical protein MPSEU_000206000 [Mayamaea pseudoterrestris]|nr:hypothetical protein MPSEU_000206000 [Mayamaea pseudoterrestris]
MTRRSHSTIFAVFWISLIIQSATARRRSRTLLSATSPSFCSGETLSSRSQKRNIGILCSDQATFTKDETSKRPSSMLNKTIRISAQIRNYVVHQPWKQTLHPLLSSSGTFYGLPQALVDKLTIGRPKLKGIRDTMSETLDEVRSIRHEMEALRKELYEMRKQVLGTEARDEEETEEQRVARNINLRKRQRKFDRLGQEIETWSSRILFDTPDEDEAWKRIECHRSLLQKGDRTKAYLSWMKDSRGEHANLDDHVEYPCLRMYSVIDAPFETVCCYLAQPDRMSEYNCLLEETKDLEEITPHSKVCLGETPQILFVKPREFITFCSHRWSSDGSLIIVNQAVDDDEFVSKTKKRPRAYAFRGANYISQHPSDPEKTRICMLAHGSPGADVPIWAMRTAVRTLAQTEPFKLFHKINEGIRQALPVLEEHLGKRREDATNLSPGDIDNEVSSRPAGISQLGYACFWPNGGGIEEPLQKLVTEIATFDRDGSDGVTPVPSHLVKSQFSGDDVHSTGAIGNDDETLALLQ